MKIRCGYDLSYYCPQAVPMQFLLNVHPSRERDLVTAGAATTYTVRSSNSDFSAASLAAADIDAAGKAVGVKPKL